MSFSKPIPPPIVPHLMVLTEIYHILDSLQTTYCSLDGLMHCVMSTGISTGVSIDSHTECNIHFPITQLLDYCQFSKWKYDHYMKLKVLFETLFTHPAHCRRYVFCWVIYLALECQYAGNDLPYSGVRTSGPPNTRTSSSGKMMQQWCRARDVYEQAVYYHPVCKDMWTCLWDVLPYSSCGLSDDTVSIENRQELLSCRSMITLFWQAAVPVLEDKGVVLRSAK